MPSPSQARFVFMGSDEIAVPVLNFLAAESDSVKLVGLYTQPDRARGRGKKIQPNSIKQWAMEHEVPVFQPEKFDDHAIQKLADLKSGVIVVMAYGHLLPQPVLDIPAFGIFNIHTSLLPELRGASPIETAVASGMSMSGVTLMKLVLKMDAGPICDQQVVDIDENETGGSYRAKLGQAGPEILSRNLPSIIAGTINETSQEESKATYCRLLVKQDGQLDFSKPARELAERVRGLFPWPGCTVVIGKTRLKVGMAGWSPENANSAPGTIVQADNQIVSVATEEGTFHITQFQKPGGRLLGVGEFLRGFPIEVGQQFISQEMHGLVSMKPVSHKRVFQLYQKS